MVPTVTTSAKPVLTLANLTISAKSGLVQRHATPDKRMEGYLVRARGAETIDDDGAETARITAHDLPIDTTSAPGEGAVARSAPRPASAKSREHQSAEQQA
jgi:hypothetical protein